MSESVTQPTPPSLFRRHLRWGWWLLLAYLTLGIGLEVLHGLKVMWYLAVDNEVRRLMFTLAHAHGSLIALLHLAFAFYVRAMPGWSGAGRSVASHTLTAASVLLPAGFFLGGIYIYDGDPGMGIVLVPIGALLLLIAVALTAVSVSAQHER